ncbi:MAG: hypothetical protein ACLQVN_01270 [Bryobacteraceae bacterium]
MLKSLLFLMASGCLSISLAAPASIGFIKSTGEFRVNGATLRGSSTLFDGNVVETAASRSVLQLFGGQVTLSPESRAKVYHDRLVLEKGTGVVKEADSELIEAETLRISPSAKNSVLQVEITGPSHVAVGALLGAAEVRNSSGVLVASLRPGLDLAFDAQAGSATSVTMTGVVVLKNGNYFLTDATTGVTVELVGTDLAKDVGKNVTITGSIIGGAAPPAGSSEVVQVASIHRVRRGGGAGGAGGAGGGGLSTGATIGIVGGVAVGGTVIGLAAAGTFSGTSSVSRQ